MRKRKKNSRMRGSKTHGGGSMKKRRGAGHRGGRGRAGSGKKGDAKKSKYWRDKKSKGFKSLQQMEGKAKAINVSDLGEKFEDGDKIDLKASGYEKLLGGGSISKKLSITVPNASESAVKKVKQAGGSVKVLNSKGSED